MSSPDAPTRAWHRRGGAEEAPTSRGLLSACAALGSMGLLLARAFTGLKRPTWPGGEIVRQIYAAGNRSVLLIAVTQAFVGMVLVFHACIQAQKVFGEMSLVGPAFLQLILREFGPTIVALMIAARVGAGLAAELASMVVTEQVDALKMNGADPARYLVAPRLLGVWLAGLALTIVGCVVAAGAGAVTANALFGVSYVTFLDLSMTRPGDVVTGSLKAAAYCLYVPLAATWAGLRARGGSEGVGRATTTGVVIGSLGVIVLSALIGAGTFAVGL